MATLSFRQARECVLTNVHPAVPMRERVSLLDCVGRVLAQTIQADRDYPPSDRSIRDGFAVRAAELPGEFIVAGEVRAGEPSSLRVEPGQAIEIMTGAGVPEGADTVVMVEHTERRNGHVCTERVQRAGEFILRRGAESRQGERLLTPGKRLDYSDVALLATTGVPEVEVYARPQVAIIATGDELVAIEEKPAAHQVRNSNSYSLAAQTAQAGGVPRILPVAPDRYDETRALIEDALRSDLVLLSGGVSAGKYDIVEKVLADLGAEFVFDRVLIQPGQPVVFGRVRETFFFGLPGNPASTMVTFRLFAAAALARLAGETDPLLPILQATLRKPFRHKAGLTRFLPALVDAEGGLTPLPWQGSGDVPALTRANAFLVADPERESYEAGDMIGVLWK